MTPRTNAAKKWISLFLIVGLLIGGGITIFAEESAQSPGDTCTDSSEMNLFFFLYNALRNNSGDVFSLLAAAVSLTLFLIVKQYLIPLLDRVLKSLLPEDEKEDKKDESRDDKEKP